MQLPGVQGALGALVPPNAAQAARAVGRESPKLLGDTPLTGFRAVSLFRH